LYIAELEEVQLSKTYEITRPGFAVIIKPRRAFLQFLQLNHTQSPLAGLCSPLLRAMASRIYWSPRTIGNIAYCAVFYWAKGLFCMQIIIATHFQTRFQRWREVGFFKHQVGHHAANLKAMTTTRTMRKKPGRLAVQWQCELSRTS
jgi:hypothetical protein